MSVLSLPEWWLAIWCALRARPHPDALATDTPETAKARERAFLDYMAKLLLASSAASWIALRYLTALSETMTRTTTLIEGIGPQNPALREAVARMEALRAFYQPPPAGDFVAPVAMLLNVVPLLIGLGIIALAARLAVRDAAWRPALGVGASAAMAASVWSAVCMWAAIQLLRHLPWVGQFWAALEAGNEGDAAAYARAGQLVAPAAAQMSLATTLASVLLVLVQVLCVHRGLRQLGAGRWRALATAVAASVVEIGLGVAARHLGLRDLILSLASV